jgi:GH43 family beta-xylosidase
MKKLFLLAAVLAVSGCQPPVSQSEDEEINYPEQIDELETDLYYTITSVAKIDSLLFIGDVEQAKAISGQIAATNVDRFRKEEKSVMIDTWTDNAWVPDSVLYQLYIDIGTMSKELYLNSARNSHDNLSSQTSIHKAKENPLESK